jgi:hypothetical protein
VLLPLLKYAAVPRLDEIGINGSVIIFTLSLSILTTVLFGLLPALRLSRPDLCKSLNERQSSSIQSGQKAARASRGVRNSSFTHFACFGGTFSEELYPIAVSGYGL